MGSYVQRRAFDEVTTSEALGQRLGVSSKMRATNLMPHLI